MKRSLLTLLLWTFAHGAQASPLDDLEGLVQQRKFYAATTLASSLIEGGTLTGEALGRAH
jgi:hypothetical protein